MSLNEKVKDVLTRAYLEPFALQSDFARENAYLIARLASEGLITTKTPSGVHGRRWLITLPGLALLQVLEFGSDEN